MHLIADWRASIFLHRIVALALYALVATNAHASASPASDASGSLPGLVLGNAEILALLPDAKVTGSSSVFPDLTGWVVDAAGVFTEGEQRNLDATLMNLSLTTTHQVVLVTVSSLGGRDARDYVKELGRLWRKPAMRSPVSVSW